MSYSVRILPRAQQDCDLLPDNVYRRIAKAILRLEGNPRPAGCLKLRGIEGYRIRMGDYRVLYTVDDSGREVFIYRVRHRKEAYRS